ncbi:MAG: toxin-antitoxin system TumE family protein [Nitrospirota bacterium]
MSNRWGLLQNIEKYKYSYYYEGRDKVTIFRYDMAPHFRNIETFPHYKHEKEQIIASNEPSLKDVLMCSLWLKIKFLFLELPRLKND